MPDPWAGSDTNPGKVRPYLADPNYFRLGYQLAAQLLNLEKNGGSTGPLIEHAEEILYGDAKRQRDASARVDARERAREILEDAQVMLDWYASLDPRKRRLEFWRDTVKAKEERLNEFLLHTVEPCLTIIVAATYQPDEPAKAEEHLATIRERVDRSEDPATGEEDISYRVFYNLACYEVGAATPDGAPADHHTRAIHYLRLALNRAPEMRRAELGRWATKDPSFRPIDEDPEYKELLSVYWPAARRPASDDPGQVASIAD